MKKIIGITQRVAIDPKTGERRDCLDQRWWDFFGVCGFIPCPLPNHLPQAQAMLNSYDLSGIVLSGGNNLEKLGGEAPERDYVEKFVLKHAVDSRMPIMGVCRGMQMIQDWMGINLRQLEGHAGTRMRILLKEGPPQEMQVNSYHHWGAYDSVPELKVLAQSEDGVIKWAKHQTHRLMGIMWHPEREESFTPFDVRLFTKFFLGQT